MRLAKKTKVVETRESAMFDFYYKWVALDFTLKNETLRMDKNLLFHQVYLFKNQQVVIY